MSYNILKSGAELELNLHQASIMDQLSWGMSQERQNYQYRVIGTSVFVDVWVMDENDEVDKINWTQYVGGVERTLDCTTGDGLYGADGLGGTGAARIELKQGIAGKHVRNYVYCSFDEHTQKLELAVSEAQPESQIGLICYLAIEDYAAVAIHPPISSQRLTQSLQHDLQSLLGFINAKLRDLGVTYSSGGGIDPDFTITHNVGALDTVELNTSPGVAKQINPQTVQPIFSLTDSVHVFNVSGNGVLPHDNWQINNLGELLELGNGTPIANGDYVNFTFWISTNHGNVSHLCVNLPDGVYTTADDAKNDINDYGYRTIPQICATTGQLICQIVMQYSTADGGTWTNALGEWVTSIKTEASSHQNPGYPGYSNNENHIKTITKVGATRMRVHFNDLNTEANYDFVSVRNGTDSFPSSVTERRLARNTFSGRLSAQSSDWITGDTIRINFTSDPSVTSYRGYSIDYIEYETVSQVGKQVKDLRGTLSGN